MESLPTVDISAFTAPTPGNARAIASQHLSEVMKMHGCAAITGHGLSNATLRDAFAMIHNLFDLPLSDKVKAPHPDTSTPHRGYLATSKERSGRLGAAHSTSEDERAFFTKAIDWKETYDIGHEENAAQPNIWLPDSILSGFRPSMVTLYEQLTRVALAILEGLMQGMNLSEQDCEVLRRIHSPVEHQMRLAHYLPMSSEDQRDPNKIRLAAHRDFSSFTLLFQDSHPGLEFQNRQTGEYMVADAGEGALYLNIGEFMERFSNGLYPSAMHRVAIPRSQGGKSEIPGRYSIPYFALVSPLESIYPMPSRVEADGKAHYESALIQTLVTEAFTNALYDAKRDQ